MLPHSSSPQSHHGLEVCRYPCRITLSDCWQVGVRKVKRYCCGNTKYYCTLFSIYMGSTKGPQLNAQHVCCGYVAVLYPAWVIPCGIHGRGDGLQKFQVDSMEGGHGFHGMGDGFHTFGGWIPWFFHMNSIPFPYGIQLE